MTVRYRTPYPNELWHSGVKGMKWGVRRWQYPDGSLTPAGRIHYRVGIYERSSGSRRREAMRELKTKNKSNAKAIAKEANANGHDSAADLAKSMVSESGINTMPLMQAAKAYREAFEHNGDGDRKEQEAWGAYALECEKICDELVGKYGDTKVKTKVPGSYYNDVKKIINSAISKYVFESEADMKSRGKTGLTSDEWEKYPDRIKKLDEADRYMRYSTDDDAEKDRRVHAWENARDKGSFDMNFLEAVQNSKIFIDGDKQALLIEYAYYLGDPKQYVRTRELEVY